LKEKKKENSLGGENHTVASREAPSNLVSYSNLRLFNPF
jgi:hypothetical protein